jgi:hypothetical protein
MENLFIALTTVIATVVRPMNKVSRMDAATGGIAVWPLCYLLYKYIAHLLEPTDLQLAQVWF